MNPFPFSLVLMRFGFTRLIHTAALARGSKSPLISSNRFNGFPCRYMSRIAAQTVETVTIYLAHQCPICFSLSFGLGNSQGATLRVVSMLECGESRRQAEAHRTSMSSLAS